MSIGNILVITWMWFLIFGGKSSMSEWIDIPEFSDESKVYRVSFNKYERNKIAERHSNSDNKYAFHTSDFYNVGNAKGTTDNPFFKFPTTTLKDDLTTIVVSQVISYKKVNDSATNLNKVTGDDNSKDDDDGVVTEEHDEETTTENPTISSEKPSDLPESTINDGGKSSLDYLPVDLFKQVHRMLLQNKQTSIKGKFDFLRKFKYALLKEIESRLAALIGPTAPTRVKRGSGWDDDHVGFPSVEGALLAISFLTFAVYLVQLVMVNDDKRDEKQYIVLKAFSYTSDKLYVIQKSGKQFIGNEYSIGQ
ncbi:uncharacterized protein LOC107039017 isoform X2 [Diachasma alloeum]|uniref:uncharacterized protein LOC107039017 isoform X2 n=1 Tax=Diachasma alloeum TaxID=454923 RepID=UPI0007384385|nr:uncharacterized protein LOC107039017 isoform X2 [Diachasma alloeum]